MGSKSGFPVFGLMPCAVLLLHRGRTDKCCFALNGPRVGMSPAPLDRGAPSQHGPWVIQKAACKPETIDVTTGFAAIPASGSYMLRNARAPACLVEAGSLAGDRDGLALLDIAVEDGVVASILPAGTPALDALPLFDLDGGIALPRLVDVHTHLDKGHIWPRRPNPDGSFMGALSAVAADREAHCAALMLMAQRRSAPISTRSASRSASPGRSMPSCAPNGPGGSRCRLRRCSASMPPSTLRTCRRSRKP